MTRGARKSLIVIVIGWFITEQQIVASHVTVHATNREKDKNKRVMAAIDTIKHVDKSKQQRIRKN